MENNKNDKKEQNQSSEQKLRYFMNECHLIDINLVLNIIKHNPGLSIRQIHKIAFTVDPEIELSVVRSRVNELINSGYVFECGDIKDPKTKQLVMTVRCVEQYQSISIGLLKIVVQHKKENGDSIKKAHKAFKAIYKIKMFLFNLEHMSKNEKRIILHELATFERDLFIKEGRDQTSYAKEVEKKIDGIKMRIDLQRHAADKKAA